MHHAALDRLSRRRLFSTSIAAAGAATAAALVGPAPRPALGRNSPASPVVVIGADGVRGTLRSAIPVADLAAAEVGEGLSALGLDTSRARFGVAAARIVYATIDPAGRPTTASGLVVLPANDDPAPRSAVWLHGTMVFRGDAASVAAESPDRAIAFALASAGYAAVAPDFLGLGDGPGFHPYNHGPSAVTASVDALRAASAFADGRRRWLDGPVLAAGFSWGGRAALELGWALQEGADPAFGLAAVAAIGGPYDFSGTLRAGLAGEIVAAPQYLAYLVVAWNRVYALYESPGEAFRAPYDATVEALFDGTHTGDEVFAGLPVGTPIDLFTPEFMARLREPTGSLARALAEADGSVDWLPRSPVDLYAARGDRDVPIANAEHALATFRSRGADVRLIDVGDVDHGASVALSLPRVLARFDDLGRGG